MATTSAAEMIRIKLDNGMLPKDAPPKLWAGTGSGKACSACEELIAPAQHEYELQYDDARASIRFHLRCHGLWEAERRRRGDLLD